jgi:hypothetical protein
MAHMNTGVPRAVQTPANEDAITAAGNDSRGEAHAISDDIPTEGPRSTS